MGQIVRLKNGRALISDCLMRMNLFRFIAFLIFANFTQAQLLINIGSTANDGTGDNLRTAFGKANTNFSDLFGYTSQLVPTNSTTGDMLQYDGTSWVQIPKGTADYFLKSGATTNLWSALPLGGITPVTGSYMVIGSDNGKMITLSPLTASVTQPVTLGTFPSGYIFSFRVISSGTATITASGGLIDGSSTMVLSRGQSATLFSDGTNYRSTLFAPNLNGEQTANQFSIINQKSLATAQTLNVYFTTDNFIQPTNEARLQIMADRFDWDEIGTGALGGFRYQNNGVTKIFYEQFSGTMNYATAASVAWSPSTPSYQTQDTSLRRKSAGVVTVATTSGSGSDSGQLSTINGTASGVYFTQTADAALANSTTETSILGTGAGTKTLAAGAVNAVGRTIRINVKGMVSNFSGSPTLTIRIKIQGVTIATGTVAMVNATNNDFEISQIITVRSTGTGGSFSTSGSFNHGMTTGSSGRASIVVAGTQTTDLTLSRSLDITAQWGTAHASNSITSQVATIEILN